MTKNIVIGVLGLLTLLFGFLAFSSGRLVGTATGPAHYQLESFWSGLQIGQRGTEVKRLLSGTCALIGVNANITASTSVSFDCAVTGVVSTDFIFSGFATTTQSTAGPGWEITRAVASSTAGFITFNITNGTGATAYPPASIASTTQYLAVGTR